MPLATAAADPLDDPPAMKFAFQGFLTGPKALSSPVVPIPRVCMLVLPTMIAPAFLSFWTATASVLGTRCLKCSNAAVVFTPAVS